jgi:hypothetical protein
MPDFISVPKTVSERFPTIKRLIEAYGLKTIEVTSGFQSGTIQDVKTWEDSCQRVLRHGRTRGDFAGMGSRSLC